VQNQSRPAARLFGAMTTLLERAEDADRLERKRIAPWVAAAREDLGEEGFTSEWEAGRALSLETALDEAAALLSTWRWPASRDPATNQNATE
ncbi:MAG: hypothetical protein M3Q50_01985, partial [Chloroflexota bacterium]|nr:hypothetical protein [Chloroflexota bacterium]